MKITVLQENLKTALGSLQKAIPSKPQLPILSSIYLQAEKNSITLAATDLYLGIKNTIPATVEKEGVMVIPGEIFKNLIFSLSAGEITLEEKDASLTITHENSKSSLPFQGSEEYPQFPEVRGEKYALSAILLKKAEQLVSFSAALDQTRPILASLLFSFHAGGLDIIATDGFRLSTLHTDETVEGLEREILIPAKALSEVFRMADQSESEKIEFTIAEELKQVLFVIDGVEIYVRLIEGEYPPYKKIIPPEFEHSFQLDWQEFASQIKRAFLFSRDTSNIVKLEIEDKKMRIKAHSPAKGEYQGEIVVSYSGEPLSISFNALYLLDFLNTRKEGELTFSMNESLKPAALRITGEDSYLYVVMPFRSVGE